MTASKALARPLAEIFSTRWLAPDNETAAATALREHGEWHGDIVHVRSDGHEMHVEASITALRGKDGQEAGTLAVIRDITERKRDHLALQESEARSRRDANEIAWIYASAPIGLCVLDKDLRFQRINSHLAEINGIPAEAHIGKTVREVLPDLADEAERLAAHVFVTGEPIVDYELSGLTEAKPGMLRHWIEQWMPIKDASGAVIGISIVADEVTERKAAEAALASSERRFRLALENSPITVFEQDLDLRYTWLFNAKLEFNDALSLGKTDAELLGATEAERLIAIKREVFKTGQPARQEVAVAASGQAPNYFDLTVEPRPGPDGQIDGIICSAIDITSRKRQEEHIRLLMGEVNHRSKNLLAVVQAIAQRTMSTQPANFMESFGQRVQALVANQDLLVQSEWKAVSLVELVRSQLAHFKDASDTRVAFDGPPVDIAASASQALGMALHELATNAAKYGALSNELGSVAIGWGLRSDAAGEARFTMSWIESGGPPVAKPARRGFGSTVMGRMVKMTFGGDAEIDFAPTGLVWRIDCPAAGLIESSAMLAPKSNGAALKEQPAQASGHRRVLVVEDEPLIAMAIAHTLAEADYDVLGPAKSVAEALALLAQSGCDIALLDTNLGAETADPVARELIRRGMPFIVTSGYTREQQPEIMRKAPLLGKPVIPELLLAEIKRCLG